MTHYCIVIFKAGTRWNFLCDGILYGMFVKITIIESYWFGISMHFLCCLAEILYNSWTIICTRYYVCFGIGWPLINRVHVFCMCLCGSLVLAKRFGFWIHSNIKFVFKCLFWYKMPWENRLDQYQSLCTFFAFRKRDEILAPVILIQFHEINEDNLSNNCYFYSILNSSFPWLKRKVLAIIFQVLILYPSGWTRLTITRQHITGIPTLFSFILYILFW